MRLFLTCLAHFILTKMSQATCDRPGALHTHQNLPNHVRSTWCTLYLPNSQNVKKHLKVTMQTLIIYMYLKVSMQTLIIYMY